MINPLASPMSGQPSAAAAALEPLDGREASIAALPSVGASAGPDAATVARWLAAAGKLNRTAASSPDFFNMAAEQAVQATGLDAVFVLIRAGDEWQILGSTVPIAATDVIVDRSALDRLDEQAVVWRRPTPRPGDPASSDGAADSIVVAPVRDDAGQVIAAVYGVRHGRGDNRRRGIRTLEARMIGLIADAVAAGLARREQEIDSARQQLLLEQAFSPAVADHLRRHPQALAGADRDVTMLFADLRGFTAIAECLSPADSYELLASVMEMLTQAIMDRGGVVIDYFGDGVSALWNAPLDVPHHADQACAAALEMLEKLPEISRRWQDLLAAPLELGIGVHAARVQVGNAGTSRRLKYGPRGSGVNIASRVQAAAKHLDVPLLATDAVRRQLTDRFATLKVCTARLPGLEEPLELFTLIPAADGPRLRAAMDRYAAALEAFEQGDLDAAEAMLNELLAEGPITPAAFLAQQTAALRQGAQGRRATDQFGCTADAVVEILAK